MQKKSQKTTKKSTKKLSKKSSRKLPKKLLLTVLLILGSLLMVILYFVVQRQTSPKVSQTVYPNFCSGYAIAADPEFKMNKIIVCGSAKGIAVDKVMASKAGCSTRADAEQAVNEACGITNPPAKICSGKVIATAPYFDKQNRADMCGVFYGNVVDRLVRNMPDCVTRDEAKKALDEACKSWGVTSSHSEVIFPSCSCQMVIKSSTFIKTRSEACGEWKSTAIDAVYNNRATGCSSKAQAKQAIEQACTGTCSE